MVDMSAKLSDGTLSESSFSDSDVSFHDPHAVGIDYYSGSGDSDIDTEPLGGKRDNRDEENEVPRRGHGKGGFKNLKNRKRRKWVMRSVESQGTTSVSVFTSIVGRLLTALDVFREGVILGSKLRLL